MPLLPPPPADISGATAVKLVEGVTPDDSLGAVDASGANFKFNGIKVSVVGAESVSTEQRGRTVWNGSSIDHVAQRVQGGVQALSVFANGRSGSTASYRFAGTELTKNDDGSVVIWSRGGVQTSAPLGFIEAPWAVDANGRKVPTAYSVQGDTLTQVLGFSKDTTFPVVADPTIKDKWWGKQVRFSKKETLGIAVGTSACATLVSKIPVIGPGIAFACGVLTTAADTALLAGKCLAINLVDALGTVTPWYWSC